MNFFAWVKHILLSEPSPEEKNISSEISMRWLTLNECSVILTRIGNDQILSTRVDAFKPRLERILPILVVLARRNQKSWRPPNDELFQLKIEINQLLQECKKRERVLKKAGAEKTRNRIAVTIRSPETVVPWQASREQREKKIVPLETRSKHIPREWQVSHSNQQRAVNRKWVAQTLDYPKPCIRDAVPVFHEWNPSKLVAVHTIGRFRRHIWNPSSTNDTKSWSIWDGSFWYNAISPLVNYLSSQIETWSLDPNNFSWAEVAQKHMNEVIYVNLIKDLPVLRSKLQSYSEQHTLDDNLRILARVLEQLRWTWWFKKNNTFRILISLIDSFE